MRKKLNKLSTIEYPANLHDPSSKFHADLCFTSINSMIPLLKKRKILTGNQVELLERGKSLEVQKYNSGINRNINRVKKSIQ